jgi:hypothetical protein
MPKINMEGIKVKQMHLSYGGGKICYTICPIICEVGMRDDG